MSTKADAESKPVLSVQGNDRRQLIIDATLEVIGERGVRGTSHRRVAKAAGVPLSTTSYYFGTLDNLLEAAFTDAIERDRIAIKTRFEASPTGADPFPELALMLYELMGKPELAILSHELVVAGVRNERLRKLARSWADTWQQALTQLLGDEMTARVAVPLTGGILERGLMADQPLPAEEIEALLRHGLSRPRG